MSPTVHARALKRATELLGSKEKLRRMLGATERSLDEWMSGEQEPPPDIFLKTVDILSVPSTRASARERSERMRAAILSTPARAPAKPRSVLGFLQARYEPEEGREMVEDALDAAVKATGTGMATLHLAGPEGLRLVAQRGFERAFLEFFAIVSDEQCACGRAMKEARRVVIADVTRSPLYSEQGRKAMLGARARAEQSTPVVGASGQLHAMLSTYYDRPRAASARELDVIDHVARRAAFWLEGGR